MLYFQMPMYFVVGVLFYLFPKAAVLSVASYFGLILIARVRHGRL